MKKHLLIAVLPMLYAFTVNAQSFSTLKKKNGENPFTEDMIKLYARVTAVDSKYTPSYSGFTFNIGVSRNEYNSGGVRVRYENPTLGDLIQGIPRAIKDAKGIVNNTQTSLTVNKWDDHAHGGGLLGWLQYYMNVKAKERFLLSAGISMGDYMYGSRYAKLGGSKEDQDPYGYFFVAGPAVMGSYVISSSYWIDAYVNYDLSFAKIKNRGTAGYPKPHFLTLGADFHTTSKLFAGIRYNSLIDRGTNKDSSNRLDISAGIFF